MSSCCIFPIFIIKCLSLSLIFFLLLKSVVIYKYSYNPHFSQCYLLGVSLSPRFNICACSWNVSPEGSIELDFGFWSASLLCFLIGEFIVFTFRVIIDIWRSSITILPIVTVFLHWFFSFVFLPGEYYTAWLNTEGWSERVVMPLESLVLWWWTLECCYLPVLFSAPDPQCVSATQAQLLSLPLQSTQWGLHPIPSLMLHHWSQRWCNIMHSFCLCFSSSSSLLCCWFR